MMLRRRCPSPIAPSTKYPPASGPRCLTSSVIAIRRFRLTVCTGSKLNRPAIPHMWSDTCGLRALGAGQGASRQTREIEVLERLHHALERVALPHLRPAAFAEL